MRLDNRIETRSSSATKLSDGYYGRLIEFYYKQPRDNSMSGMWSGLVNTWQKDIKSALDDADFSRFKSLLEEIGDGSCLYGIDVCRMAPLDGVMESLKDNIENDLLSLLVYLGVVPLFNPEQPVSITVSTKEAIDAIEKIVGFHIDYDCGGNIDCAFIYGRMIPWRTLQSIYEYTLIVKTGLIEHNGHSELLEIGAGTCALNWLLRQKHKNIIYHTVDLPIMSVVQGYLMAVIEGENGVWLSGEGRSDKANVMIHGTNIQDTDKHTLDIVFNKDSLPEMPIEVGLEYLRRSLSKLVNNGIFLSLNHESTKSEQHSVASLMQKFKNMALRSRSLCWNRVGYVEEIWVKNED